MPLDFGNLHTHSSAGSLLDGLTPPDKLAQRAAELGYKFLALTDHGMMTGIVPFTIACKKVGIQPICGIEGYYTIYNRRAKPTKEEPLEDHTCHLTVLVKNEVGYRNLCNLVTQAWLTGYYRKPRFDEELLRKYHEGLFILSGCLSGPIARFAVQEGKWRMALQQTEMFLDIFGRENFAVELMPADFPEQALANHRVSQIAKHYKLRQVLTLDSHYGCAEDADVHDILLAVQTGKSIKDPDRMRFPAKGFYLRTLDEIKLLQKDFPGAIETASEIAALCTYVRPLKEFGAPLAFPEFRTPDGSPPLRYLGELAMYSLERHLQKHPEVNADVYQERLVRELDVISKSGFVDYMLVFADLIGKAKEDRNRPCGPGRGSVGGSLVAFLLRITELDPVRYKIPFERFLGDGSAQRKGLPDIDTDWGRESRAWAVNYLKGRYGAEHVTPICTYSKLTGRAVLQDVMRAMDIPFDDRIRVTSQVPQSGRFKVTLKHALEHSPGFRKALEKYPELLQVATALEGIPRHVSVHAGGFVLTPEPVTNYFPLFLARPEGAEKAEKIPAVQADLEAVEQVAVKMDLLVVTMLDILWQARASLLKHEGIDLDVHETPLDDPESYKLIAAGRTDGIFQLGGDAMKKLLRDLKPTCLEDVALPNALIRPGAEAGAKNIIECRAGRKQPRYILECLRPVLESTWGEFVYQEQLIEAGKVVAGFSFGEAEALRKAAGKKDPVLMEQQHSLFVEKAVVLGHPRETAEILFKTLAKFAEYGFNQAHAFLYAVIAVWSAWWKVHHPTHFFSAVLTKESGNDKEFPRYVRETRRAGIELLPPDIELSHPEFTWAGEGRIRWGLGATKGVGDAALRNLQRAVHDFDEQAHLGKYWTSVPEQAVVILSLESYGAAARNRDMDWKFLLARLAEEQGEYSLWTRVSDLGCEFMPTNPSLRVSLHRTQELVREIFGDEVLVELVAVDERGDFIRR